MDVLLKKFYHACKDPSWPTTVDTYQDLKNLPPDILDELYQYHGLSQHLTKTENFDYQASIGAHSKGYKHKNVVYIPFARCASTNYTKIFHDLGWAEVNLKDLDWDICTGFAPIREPLERRIKGLVNCIMGSFKGDVTIFENPGFCKFVSLITVGDHHCEPYWSSYVFAAGIQDHIHWIPLEKYSDTDLDAYITKFLDHHGINVIIPSTRFNKSNNFSQRAEQKIKQILEDSTSDSQMNTLYKMYAKDIKFYRMLLDKFDTNHIQ